jgi:serine phosphatase RsbU (regulator of sigma subunit)/anti-sigma regulatory factor (Ser/Thr protein kinase)
MIPFIRKSIGALGAKKEPLQPEAQIDEAVFKSSGTQAVEVEINMEDPLMEYLIKASGVVEIDRLNLDSPTLRTLKDAGVRISVPLVSQGELIGLLNLGPRLSEQEYSSDDKRLLNTLATQAAPALRVAQLARQQQQEARERERMEQELRVARVIQQTLLPKQIPDLQGWHLAAHWQPARAVSGDFYDFFEYPDGKLGVVTGDVTDKGVPAALVMATTRSILRSASERLESPRQVLSRANEVLCTDIPHNMFVTCLFILVDLQTGEMIFANAGHNLPYKRTDSGVDELRATGMPLGLLPGMEYEEKRAMLMPGESVLLFSDGLIEAHNPQGEMFGFPRLHQVMEHNPGGSSLIPLLLDELATFTGLGWEQEDDVTFVTLEREKSLIPVAVESQMAAESDWQVLTKFSLPSEPGNERLAMDKVAEAVEPLHIRNERLERLKTAVAETALNAMEHGNHYQPLLNTDVLVKSAQGVLKVYVTDHGGGQKIPTSTEPDLEAKLEGLQSPRGWGLFLIKNMVDEMHIYTDEVHHTVELIMNLEGKEP